MKARWALDKDTLLADLGDLIAIDTSNPPGKELEAAKVVKEKMASLGAISTLQEFSSKRANAICRLPFSRPEEGPCLIFNSHLDVVHPGEVPWKHPDRYSRPRASGPNARCGRICRGS